MTSKYAETYAAWQQDPEGFWAEAAGAIDWFKPWDQVFASDEGVYGRWFKGAECNTCYNALDRHVANGRGDQVALIYESPVTGSVRKFTYRELLEEVEALSAVMLDNGVSKGDRVLIYMPMVPEAAVAMLAAARIGAVHSVVFGGFAANELATRIDDAKPVMIIAGSCGIEPTRVVPYQAMLDKAIATARHTVRHCIILQREQHPHKPVEGRDIDYRTAVDAARGRHVPCTPVAATDPLYVLYTSGTTGEPKGVVRDNGGHMVALAWSLKHVFGIEPGQVFWAASDVGWVVGHSYIVYAPLIAGATSILFEGKPVGTPDAGSYWRIIAEHGVEVMFTAPAALRAIKKEDVRRQFRAPIRRIISPKSSKQAMCPCAKPFAAWKRKGLWFPNPVAVCALRPSISAKSAKWRKCAQHLKCWPCVMQRPISAAPRWTLPNRQPSKATSHAMCEAGKTPIVAFID